MLGMLYSVNRILEPIIEQLKNTGIQVLKEVEIKRAASKNTTQSGSGVRKRRNTKPTKRRKPSRKKKKKRYGIYS